MNLQNISLNSRISFAMESIVVLVTLQFGRSAGPEIIPQS